MGIITSVSAFRMKRHINKPPLILLDYDGVIADSYEVYFREFTNACTKFGFDKLNSEEAFLRLFDGNLVAQLVKAGFPIRKLKQLADELKPQIEAANAQIHPFPGIVQILKVLSEKHPVLIITANDSALVKNFLIEHGLRHIHDVVGSDTETSKVKKIRAARKRFMNYAPFYIGDTRGDMIEAKRAGAFPVGAGWGWHDHDRLQSANPLHILEKKEYLIPFFEYVSPD